MMTIVWLLCLGLTVLMLTAAGRGVRYPGAVNWFALQPFMRPSKKAKGRAQQRRKPRR